MIRSEFLRVRYSTTARVTGAVALVIVVGQALVLALFPAIIDGLIALNEVVPNATDADQMSADQLAAFDLSQLPVQLAVVDLTGSAAGGVAAAGVLVCVFAGLMVANEFRRGSMVVTMLTFPRRYDILTGKVVVTAVIVVAACAVLAVTRLGALLLGARAQDTAVTVGMGAVLGAWGRGTLALVLLAAAAMGLALLVRTPAATLSLVVAVAVVETSVRPIASFLFDGWNVTRLLPFGLVSEAVARPGIAVPGFSGAVPGAPWWALLGLVGWAVLLLGGGYARTLRSDVLSPNET